MSTLEEKKLLVLLEEAELQREAATTAIAELKRQVAELAKAPSNIEQRLQAAAEQVLTEAAKKATVRLNSVADKADKAAAGLAEARTGSAITLAAATGAIAALIGGIFGMWYASGDAAQLRQIQAAQQQQMQQLQALQQSIATPIQHRRR